MERKTDRNIDREKNRKGKKDREVSKRNRERYKDRPKNMFRQRQEQIGTENGRQRSSKRNRERYQDRPKNMQRQEEIGTEKERKREGLVITETERRQTDSQI